MDFSLTEEQQELSKTLHAVLQRHADSAAVRRATELEIGYDRELWRLLAEEVGVASLAIPEEYGGAGYSWIEAGLAMEVLGYHLAPTPLLASGVVATAALLESKNADACARLLPAIAEGAKIATLAWANAQGKWDTARSDITATPGDAWMLNGTATLVLDGLNADTVIAVAATPCGIGLFEVLEAQSIARAQTPALDTTFNFTTFNFAQVPARPLLLDAASALEKVRDIALVARSCMQAGSTRRGLDMTVAYSTQRVQFGRPIGSFQALKHRMADMLVQVETARTAAWAAAWAAGTNSQELPVRAASAAAWCSYALDYVASECVQLHGGIAITWEHDAQMLFKRAHATGQLFGQARAHRQRLGNLLGISAT